MAVRPLEISPNNFWRPGAISTGLLSFVAASNYPLANAVSPLRTQVFRTVNTPASGVIALSEWNGSFEVERPYGKIVLVDHNFAIGTKVKAVAYFGYPTVVGESAVKTLAHEDVFSPHGRGIIELDLPNVTADKIEIQFTDATSTGAAYYQIGRIWGGPTWFFSEGASYPARMSWIDPTTLVRTAGGTLRADIKPWAARQLEIVWETIEDTERTGLAWVFANPGRQELYLNLFAGHGGGIERDGRMICRPVQDFGFDAGMPKFFSARVLLEET